MTVRHGIKPATVDVRDFSFHKSFPEFGATTPTALPFLEYNYDIGKTIPDQNADGYPYGCTGYTTTEYWQNIDGILYKAGFTYRKTCLIEGHDMNEGCDVRNALKSARVYGLQAVDEDTDQQALQHHKGKTFFVDKSPGRDWFDSMRIALRAHKDTRAGISIGTPWFPEWQHGGQNGVLTSNFFFDGNVGHYLWHNYLLVGELYIAGEPLIILKPWQGRNFGSGGWCYMGREAFNKAFDIYGTIAACPGPYDPKDIVTIKPELLQLVLVYLNRILMIIGRQIPNLA